MSGVRGKISIVDVPNTNRNSKSLITTFGETKEDCVFSPWQVPGLSGIQSDVVNTHGSKFKFLNTQGSILTLLNTQRSIFKLLDTQFKLKCSDTQNSGFMWMDSDSDRVIEHPGIQIQVIIHPRIQIQSIVYPNSSDYSSNDPNSSDYTPEDPNSSDYTPEDPNSSE
jgi:hypothetical protein